MTSPLLEADGVSKLFPGVRALSDMHLELRSGEVLALVGENGAGKSTLMKLLSGIYSADAGEFRLDGEPFEPASPAHAIELGIGIIHQEFNLVPHLTVAQNIYLGREPRNGLLLGEKKLNADAAELLDRLRLPLDPRAVVGSLTVANQQLTEIAKALSLAPKVLIMDEPTAALNEAEVATLHELIRHFVREGTGAIYISHRLDEVSAIADRVTVIRDGEYIDTLEATQATQAEIIKRMVGRETAVSSRGEVVPSRGDVAPSRGEVVLTARELTTKALLKEVSFELRRGEILGFAGLMGAGRTEVGRALVGADRLQSGSITVHGKPVRIANPADAARYGMGYLSEDRKRYGLLLEQDVKSNIVLGALRNRLARAGFVADGAARTLAREYVGALRIKTPSVDQTTKFLSGGNQQKVVIAKWLAKDCDILIFDEPTRGIDVGAKEEIYALLHDLANQGKGIIMISSELPEVLRMAHRVVVMSEGRVTAALDAQEATEETIMHFATSRGDGTTSSRDDTTSQRDGTAASRDGTTSQRDGTAASRDDTAR